MSDNGRMPDVDAAAVKLGLPPRGPENALTLSNGATLRLKFFSPVFFLQLVAEAARRWPTRRSTTSAPAFSGRSSTRSSIA